MVVRVGAGRSPERAFHITQLGDGVAQNLVGLCLGPIARTRAKARVQVERRTQMSQGGRDMFHRSNAMPLIVVVSPSEAQVHRVQQRNVSLVRRQRKFVGVGLPPLLGGSRKAIARLSAPLIPFLLLPLVLFRRGIRRIRGTGRGPFLLLGVHLLPSLLLRP